MSYFPILLDLRGKTVLVVGGGEVAERKILNLLEYDASIQLISHHLTKTLERLVEDGEINYVGKEFEQTQVKDAFLVVAATDDGELNHLVAECARKHHQLVNVVDQPSDCDFILPSIVRRGDFLVAISTSGKSPALAKRTRKELERRFGEEYGRFLILMGGIRKAVLSLGFSQKENRRIFYEIVQSDLLKALAKRNRTSVEIILKKILPPQLSVEGLVDVFPKDELKS